MITDQGGSPYAGTAIWKNVQNLIDGTTPWPTITVTRPAGMAIPNPEELCNIFRWVLHATPARLAVRHPGEDPANLPPGTPVVGVGETRR